MGFPAKQFEIHGLLDLLKLFVASRQAQDPRQESQPRLKWKAVNDPCKIF